MLSNKNCVACGNKIQISNDVCEYCGNPHPNQFTTNNLIKSIIGLLIIFVVLYLTGIINLKD